MDLLICSRILQSDHSGPQGVTVSELSPRVILVHFYSTGSSNALDRNRTDTILPLNMLDCYDATRVRLRPSPFGPGIVWLQ